MMTKKERTVLFNIFYRAGLDPSFGDVMELSPAEAKEKLEAIRSKRYVTVSIEDMLLSQPRCGQHSCLKILSWLGIRPSTARTVEDMRQEISDDLVDLTQDQVRAMWRAMKRTKT